jgi:hypothetical protein
MRVVRALLGFGLLLLLVAAGCSSPSTPSPVTLPPSPEDQTLCALLTPQDFSDAGASASGKVEGGGTAESVTCVYGTDLQMVVQVLPSVENASASYQALVDSGWFTANTKSSPVTGVDESMYGTGPDGAALVLRRQKLVVLVTMPGNDRQAPLVQLATKALSRATTLGA